MSESREDRLKRLKIRSWWRGTKEMDLILGPFFDDRGGGLSPATLDAYEALLSENDQDIYLWVSGRSDIPPEHSRVVSQLRAFVEKSH